MGMRSGLSPCLLKSPDPSWLQALALCGEVATRPAGLAVARVAFRHGLGLNVWG